MSNLIVVDVEADGPIPGHYNMVSFGAVFIDKNSKLDNTFYGETQPVFDRYIPEALAVSGITREQHRNFPNPLETMTNFDNWLSQFKGNKIFISDNLAFDWQFINWYFHVFLNKNPFGFSGQRIGDKFQGFFNDPWIKWKQHRKTKHTHNPVDDAKGNAEALLYLKSKGYKLW